MSDISVWNSSDTVLLGSAWGASSWYLRASKLGLSLCCLQDKALTSVANENGSGGQGGFKQVQDQFMRTVFIRHMHRTLMNSDFLSWYRTSRLSRLSVARRCSGSSDAVCICPSMILSRQHAARKYPKLMLTPGVRMGCKTGWCHCSLSRTHGQQIKARGHFSIIAVHNSTHPYGLLLPLTAASPARSATSPPLPPLLSNCLAWSRCGGAALRGFPWADHHQPCRGPNWSCGTRSRS